MYFENFISNEYFSEFQYLYIYILKNLNSKKIPSCKKKKELISPTNEKDTAVSEGLFLVFRFLGAEAAESAIR